MLLYGIMRLCILVARNRDEKRFKFSESQFEYKRLIINAV